jgi:hypothetical protein
VKKSNLRKQDFKIKVKHMFIQIQAKCQAYNMLAHSLKLIPINAENSSGIDFELKKTAYNEGIVMDFQDRIKV